jgi:hypothetical protein
MYGFPEKLQAFFPLNIPFLTTSTTLPPLALCKVWLKLTIEPDTSFYLNLGNNHPNIVWSMQQINESDNYKTLCLLFATNITKANDITRAIVFMNTVNGCQIGCKQVHRFFAKPLCKYVDSLHSHWTVKAKWCIMCRFQQGKSRFLSQSRQLEW